MIKVTVTKTSTPAGAGKMVAKCKGKQRSTRWDHSLSADANLGAAVGAVLDVVLDSEQKAKMRHPSAKGRVRESGWLNGTTEFHIDV